MSKYQWCIFLSNSEDELLARRPFLVKTTQSLMREIPEVLVCGKDCQCVLHILDRNNTGYRVLLTTIKLRRLWSILELRLIASATPTLCRL
jgi:hypothetical protein